MFTFKQHGPTSNFFAANDIPDIDTTNLIVRYDINNSSSYTGGLQVTDLMGNSNAFVSGIYEYNSSIPYYIDLNASSEYITTSSSIASFFPGVYPNRSTSYSLFMLVKLTSEGVLVSELAQSTPNTSWHYSVIEFVNNTFIFNVWYNNIFSAYSPASYNLNEWYVVGVTYDGSTLRGYVNGAEVGALENQRLTPYNSSHGDNLFYAVGAIDSTEAQIESGANMNFGALYIWNTTINQTNINILTKNLISRIQ